MEILYGYLGMIIILLAGMLCKGRKTKYRFRIGSYIYMILLESIHCFFVGGEWLQIWHIAIALFWVGLAYADIKSSAKFDLEFAKLDRMKEESQKRIDKFFYEQRN